jgi:hypothetical protein
METYSKSSTGISESTTSDEYRAPVFANEDDRNAYYARVLREVEET